MPLRILICACAMVAAAPACATETPLCRTVADFSLRDFRGREHQLSDYAESDIVVLAVLGTECPLVKLYGPRLESLQQEYADRGVTFLGINANVQDSITEIAAYARVHAISFPILKDLGNKVADQIGAVRTPEMFVLDKQRVVRYHGRVDDQWGVGYVRDEPQSHDLRNAIADLLAGRPVKTPQTEVVGCHIGRIQEPIANPTVTYCNQIARILQRRCVECHRDGEIAPFTLTDYAEVVGWAEMIEEVVRENRMPPWHADPQHGEFRNDRSLTDEERELIYQWVADGAPQGDPNQLPPPKQYVTGWQLPRQPDLVLDVSPEPFRVKAEGEIRYQWFTADPQLREDKWLAAAEILPGNRAVVHHILAFAREPGRRGFSDQEGFLVGYVPGLRARTFPQGMAKRLPAGSQLVFQVHYTPIGTEQFDQSKIGLIFADPAEITHQIRTTQAMNRGFSIPPGERNHRVDAHSSVAHVDLLLLSLMPHMHLRGKSFSYTAEFPNGSSETLLDIPAYDFNWQTAYQLSEPKKLPRGTRIRCVAHFDNSEYNLNNPDPGATVRWGDQTWDEMMIGYFDIAYPLQPAADPAAELANYKGNARTVAAGIVAKLDSNGDGAVQRSEVEKKVLPIFIAVDQDRDGIVTAEELADAIQKQRAKRN